MTGKVDGWCGYYARYVLKEAYERAGVNYEEYIPYNKMSGTGFVREYLNGKYGGVYYAFTDWYYVGNNGPLSAKKDSQAKLASYKLKPGDIVLVETNGSKEDGPDHIGVIIKVNADGSFITSEGNTGDGTKATRQVRRHTYIRGSDGIWHRQGDTERIVHVIISVQTP